MIDFGMTLDQAVAAPRFHVQQDRIILEKGISSGTVRALTKLGHEADVKAPLLRSSVETTVHRSSMGDRLFVLFIRVLDRCNLVLVAVHLFLDCFDVVEGSKATS